MKIPDTPSMPVEAVVRLEQALLSSECYLEYGSGGSTALALRCGVDALICVESDKDWLEALQENLPTGGSTNRIFIHGNIGPTKEWGHPVDDTAWKQFHHYPISGWLAAREKQLQPDLVLIDGRFRRACFYAALIFSKPGTTILFDDYTDRSFYHSIERFMRPVGFHARMAEFVVPAEIDKSAVWLELMSAVTEVH